MRNLIFIIICGLCLLPTSASSQDDCTTAAAVAELPLPNVPDTLRTPAERANYIIAHFWDAMDFRDTHRSHTRDFMEQNFSNFISVFPYASEQAQRTAVATLLSKAEADSAAYVLLKDIAEKYLYDPSSPMVSEDYYIFFLEHFVNATILGEHGIIRPRRQLDAARKNRPGMTAADFAYITREDSATTLYRTAAKGDLLLIFYDPDCEHCKETMQELQSDTALSDAVASGRMTVLAIYSGDDHSLWKHTAATLPASWTVGYESGLLQENGSYVLRTMPTLYLLNADKKVLQKDVQSAQLLQWLHDS